MKITLDGPDVAKALGEYAIRRFSGKGDYSVSVTGINMEWDWPEGKANRLVKAFSVELELTTK